MGFWDLVNLTIGGMFVRQLIVLEAVLRARRFLCHRQVAGLTQGEVGQRPAFYIIIPVLREAAGLRQAIAHFEAIADRHNARIVVVTTAREANEAGMHPAAGDTVAVAEELATRGRSVHLHYPDPSGLKADQLNFAVDHCFACPLVDVPCERAFVVIYDADSRPPVDSLTYFENAIARNPLVSIFHQSSRFELRPISNGSQENLISRVWRAIADSGALRANRFVLGYELPRLLNRRNRGRLWAKVTSYVYTHVTGHGLCVRLSLLREMPFPRRSPLEDMHYSFLLGSRNVPMVPIASLDCAGVPDSLWVQFRQLTRWSSGPARFLGYLADPTTQPGWRSRLLAVSAAGITVEWMSCAIILPLLSLFLWFGNYATCAVIGLLVVAYVGQLIVSDSFMGTAKGPVDRALRFLFYPITFTMFGVAGLVGIVSLIRGISGSGKTERS